MSNDYFQFKQFTIHQDRTAMKVTTDACLFGAWVAAQLNSYESSMTTKGPSSKISGETRRMNEGPSSKTPGETRRMNKSSRLLDIGAGTGLLSLMIAQQFEADIDAIEIDPSAAQQAKENIDLSSWKNKITVIAADAKKFTPIKPYDVIVSNPPFYESELKSPEIKRNIAHHGEALALHDVVELIEKNLSGDGRFFFLLPFKRQKEINEIFLGKSLSIFQQMYVRQTTEHDHFRIMIEGGRRTGQHETRIAEMSIRNDKGEYTPEFFALLKDYYLYL